MPKQTSPSAKKKEESPWVKHVKKTWADMGGKEAGVSYKMAMCAASQCWKKGHAEQYPKKKCGTGKKGTKCYKKIYGTSSSPKPGSASPLSESK